MPLLIHVVWRSTTKFPPGDVELTMGTLKDGILPFSFPLVQSLLLSGAGGYSGKWNGFRDVQIGIILRLQLLFNNNYFSSLRNKSLF